MDDLNKLLGVNDEGLSQAEAEVLKSLLDEEKPLFKSELTKRQIPHWIRLVSYAKLRGLNKVLEVANEFIKAQVPKDRKRVSEIIEALRRVPKETKKRGILGFLRGGNGEN